ncbi:MAG: HAD hydrolase-like protein [Alphaproteobacteria bacterium]|nr:HAD hydrolase-like protein [Alphaproteobacteria bacterium]
MTKLPKPTIVIFDMDGTTVRHLNPRMLGMMEWLDDTAFKISRLWMWLFARRAKGPILLPPPDEPVKPAKSIIVHKAIHKLRRKDLELLVEPCPGIYSVLSFLKRHNIPMALVSNGLGKGYGNDIVETFGLNEYFPVTIFREDIKKSKPHPEPLLMALRELDVETTGDQVIWYIGDRHKDVTAVYNAKKHVAPAKIVPIAYAVNAAVAAIEKGYGPDHILMSYQDVYIVLKELFTRPEGVPSP